MALFGNKKKEEKNTPYCCCETPEETEAVGPCCEGSQNADEACCGESAESICNVKVLGAGCKSCHEQYENVKKAISEMGLDIEVEYITDMEKVMTYGVMSMPAIVVNENVISMGKVLKSVDVKKLLCKFGF